MYSSFALILRIWIKSSTKNIMIMRIPTAARSKCKIYIPVGFYEAKRKLKPAQHRILGAIQNTYPFHTALNFEQTNLSF